MPVNTYILTVTNPGAETGTTAGWTSNGGFTVRSATPAPQSGSFYFQAGTGVASAFARQDLDITIDAANTAIDQNIAAANISWWQAGTSGLDTDTGAIQLRFMNGSSFLANTSVTQVQYDTTWVFRSVDAPIPYGTRKIRVEMVSTRTTGSPIDVFYDSISNVIVNTGYANTNVASIYAEVIGEFIPVANVNVASLYAETISDLTTANANVYQFYSEVIVGAILPKVLVAGGV